MFWSNSVCEITKESLYNANSLACFLAKRDTPVAATLQRKYSGGINNNNFVIITENGYKEKRSKELSCNNFGLDGFPSPET